MPNPVYTYKYMYGAIEIHFKLSLEWCKWTYQKSKHFLAGVIIYDHGFDHALAGKRF